MMEENRKFRFEIDCSGIELPCQRGMESFHLLIVVKVFIHQSRDERIGYDERYLFFIKY